MSPGLRIESSGSPLRGEQVALVPDEKAGLFSPQRANKGSKVMERLRKKLSEQESLLLLMSPSMAFRVHSRNGKVSAVQTHPAARRPQLTDVCHMSRECTCPSDRALGYGLHNS